MSKNKNKNKKPDNAVNPIIFGCNELTRLRVEQTIGYKDKFIVDGVMTALTDEKSLYRKRRLKVLPFSVHQYKKDTGLDVDLSGALGCPINAYLCDAYIYPGQHCRIRKLSARATQFLLSLGAPTDELRFEYRKYLAEAASAGETEIVQEGIDAKFYEELIELPFNGHTEYIYLLSSPEMCYIIHRRDPRYGENEYFNIPIHERVRTEHTKGPEQSYDDSYDNAATGAIFDVEALLANLWIAETTRTCEPCSEPEWSKFATDRPVILAGKKPLKHSQAYRYIHITDDNWKKYEGALTSTREYKNFSVPSWLVRAHYAKMHGKTVFIKAHFAYRRKGVVNNTETVDYIV